jgi:DNA-binding XRE family transcriptional regulator
MEIDGRQLPNTLRMHRRLFHYKQKEAALMLNVRPNVLSAWETGKMKPDMEHLLLLSTLYKTLPQQLFPEHTRMLRKKLERQVMQFHSRKNEEQKKSTPSNRYIVKNKYR